uniref:Phospholipid-transporting ATPase n=1 Tax=Macrostomum lignano TaxID=282301 RepID=A0A1I8JBV6_9PLAT
MLITAFITFHTIVPISLQVTLEFMRIFQAYFIQCDLDMYEESSDIAAEARTSSLNEELGQINFVFSDKTGTLTQNCMVFQGASVAGRVYGEVDTNAETGALQFKSGVGAIRQLVDGGAAPAELDLFLTVLAVCHTVIPEKAADGSVLDYSASSPDEAALVVAAKSAGYELCDRSLDTFVTIRAAGQERVYKTLAKFEFTSDRKRMSMVVQCPDGSIRLFMKGADSAIYSRLGSERHAQDTTAHMEKFAVAGLRTLCIATARIEPSRWEQLEAEYQRACNHVENREQLLADVASKIETNLELLGATAIEDKLQVGVPATINDLLLAGIRIWVLTGDKLETAINIGYSCRLLQSGMEVRTLTGSGLDDVRSKVAALQSWVGGLEGSSKEPALVVEGEALAWAGRPELRAEFLEVCLQCRTVICCRVSPKQKSDVVRYVREALPTAVTLAIGDGANDVPMIQESHVGVGLKGKEGLQAAAASDYALAQFRFLKKLLFVHGAWSYHRVTIVILFSFYKNLTLYITSFWFAMASGFSGQVMFEKWTQGLYNVFFTGATPFALGIFDRSCSQENCMRYPQLYKENQGSGRYNFKVFALWMLNGVYHSAIIFGCVALALWHGSVFPNGQVSGLYYLGSTVYSLAVAAAASDYALAQFRFLKKLLFVHGAWSYHRVTIVILFSFYKNLTLYITSFWFAMASGFSGQVMFEKWTQGLYNVFFTGATPFALGIFDRSCSQENCMRYPQLYKENQGSGRYNFKVFALWMLNGVYHSAIIFGCVALALWHGSVFPNGQVSGLYYLGSTVYSLAVVTVALKAGIEHTAWTGLSHLAIWGSVATYFGFVALSANLYPHVGSNFAEVVGFDWALFGSANFWFLVLLAPLLALTRDLAWTAYRRTCAKTLREEVMEMEKLQRDPSSVLLRNTYKRMTETVRLLGRPLFRRKAPVPVSQSVADNIDQMAAGANNRSGYAFSCDDHPTVSPADLLKSTCPQRGSDAE